MRPKLIILAEKNPDKNCLEKKKDKKQEKRKH